MKTNIKAVQNDYEKLAATYEARWAAFLASARGWVLSRATGQTPPARIIDLGCGTGEMLKMLGERFPAAALTGIDASPAMLDVARRTLPQADLKTGDIQDIDGRYDMVLSLNVLHHLPDAGEHLQTLRDLCTENGTVYLCDFALDSLKMRAAELYWRGFHPAHRKAYSSRALQKLIKENGLHICAQAVLKPDYFWRLQIYKLSRP